MKTFTMILFVVIIVVAVLSTSAQKPHPCESPKQYEGKFSIYVYPRKEQIYTRFAYDDIHKRFRESEILEFGKQHEYYDLLYLQKEGLAYKLNLRTRQCNVTKITWPFRPITVPSKSKFAGIGVYGAAGIPNEHVDIIKFEGLMGTDVQYQIFVSSPHCIFLQSSYYNKTSGPIEHRQYFDVSLGISDPEVFIPPPECNKS